MLLIKNAHIRPMAGEDIANGEILIDGGKIAGIGVKVDAPEDAEIIDAEGRLVTPGIVEAHCHTGDSARAIGISPDHNEKNDSLTPQLRIMDSFNPYDPQLRRAIKAGVTSGVTTPGSANIIGGTAMAVKFVGRRVDDMIIKNPAAMKIAFGENAKRVYGTEFKKAPMTRMAIASMLREILYKARNYMETKEAGKEPAFDMKYEALIPVLRREIPMKAHAHRADDIFTAIRIAKEFNLRMTIDHCTDGALIADILAEEGYPAFVGPTSGGTPTKHEVMNRSFETPAILHKAGVPFAIITDDPVITIEALPLCAGLAVRHGLPEEEAWKAITIYSATYTGIGERVGSLEVGKDADVVIWNGNPVTDITATVYRTIVDGNVVYCQGDK